MLYSAKDPTISACIYDSPFSSLEKLATDLALKKTGLPKLIISGVISLIKQTILTKAKFNISDLDLKNKAGKIIVPGLFLVSKQDKFVNFTHSEKLIRTPSYFLY